MRTPDLKEERRLWSEGYVVAGVDEAGWGAWAGPLSVGVAVVPEVQEPPNGLKDSKDLTPGQREVDPLSWTL